MEGKSILEKCARVETSPDLLSGKWEFYHRTTNVTFHITFYTSGYTSYLRHISDVDNFSDKRIFFYPSSFLSDVSFGCSLIELH